MTRKEALIGAFCTLKARPGLSSEAANDLIEIAADKLSLMAGPHRGVVPPAFRNVSFNDADSERKKIEHLARELANQIEAIHKPTVIALAEAGILRDRLGSIASELRELVAITRRAKIDQGSAIAQPGMNAKGPIKVIRRIVADTFYRVTGSKPSAAGEFLLLSRKVIAILDLDDKPGGFAKAAYEDFHGAPLSD